MVYKGKKRYKVTTGDYKNKTNGLHFGYEYSSGNKVVGRKSPQKKDNL
ncbi:hypothetical protein QGM71_06330 [Virgibacillus sp. C22-A2]|uniref:Uncharacterized protein n=1 Tax=Virgibacillus tibetensis TaxID=3042313 RepID=A0ABU6KDG5_9BACI|nr:hypothetical protein [Virgibacillus sp. C22-A2]